MTRSAKTGQLEEKKLIKKTGIMNQKKVFGPQ
jgi:hypothetical protein